VDGQEDRRGDAITDLVARSHVTAEMYSRPYSRIVHLLDHPIVFALVLREKGSQNCNACSSDRAMSSGVGRMLGVKITAEPLMSIELASAILVSAIRAPSFTALSSIIGARN
jgi:hypothetical protein